MGLGLQEGIVLVFFCLHDADLLRSALQLAINGVAWGLRGCCGEERLSRVPLSLLPQVLTDLFYEIQGANTASDRTVTIQLS